MDNQNDNKGGLVNLSKNILEGKIGPQEDVKKYTDASGQMEQQSVIVQPGNYENVQSQSLVESARETANEELAQIKAYNEQMLHMEKVQEQKNKAKRGAIYVVLGIFGVIVVGVLVWMLVNAIIAMQGSARPDEIVDNKVDEKYDTVDGFKCETSKCYKVTDLPDGRILVRDTSFYIFDTETEESVMTNIENEEYHLIKAFQWGKQILVELDPESEKSGLYSITDNRQIISNKYDTFYTSIKDDVYKEQTWIEGDYIIAKLSGSYRLVNLVDGSEVIRGAEKVFMHDQFCVSYEQGGERRLYTLDGKQFLVIKAGEELYIKGSSAIYAIPNAKSPGRANFTLYTAAGTKETKSAEYDVLRKVDKDSFLSYLGKNYYKVQTIE